MQNTFVKKFAATLVTMLLLSTVILNGATANQENPAVETDIFRLVYAAQVVQDTLYMLTEEKLISITQDQEEPTTIINFLEYPDLNWYSASLFSDEAILYIYDPLSETIYQVDGPALNPIVKLSFFEDGEELEDDAVKPIFEYPLVQNGFLYVLCTDFTDYSKTLYRFSMENGKGSQISTNGYEFQEITPYKNGQLLCLDFDTQALIIFDPATEKTIDKIELLSVSNLSAIAYDCVNDKVYSLCNTQVVRWENNKPVTIGYSSPSDRIYAGIFNNQYTLINSGGLRFYNMVLEKVKTNILTIWSESRGLPDPNLLSNFMKLYPQTPVSVYDTSDEDSLEKIAKAILTGDGAIDIFVVLNQSVNGENIFSRGYAYELNSAILKEDVLLMYPQIQDYLMYNSTLFAFPLALSPRYWTVRPDLLKEAQLGAIPNRIEDYYDMMLLWYENNYSNHPAVTFDGNQTIQQAWREAIYRLLEQYVYTYASDEKPLSFNTPAFRAPLEKLFALAKWKGEDTPRNYSNDTERSIFKTSFAVSPLSQRLHPNSWGEEYILPPAFAEAAQPILVTGMYYYIVNPHSQNKEEAIKFLEFSSQNMDLLLKYELHPDYNELVERNGYQDLADEHAYNIANIKNRIAALNKDDSTTLLTLKEELAQEEINLAQNEKNRWEYSPEAIAQYRQLAPYMAIDRGDLIWALIDGVDVEAILFKYFEGRATLDQVLSELDSRVAMVFGEMQ